MLAGGCWISDLAGVSRDHDHNISQDRCRYFFSGSPLYSRYSIARRILKKEKKGF